MAENLLWSCAQIVAPRPPINRQRPNQAMERTADRRTLHFLDDFHTSTPSAARLRPPSLISFSLGLMRALAIVMLRGFGGSAFAGEFHSYSTLGKMDDKHYQFTASQANIARSPVWAPDADFPPLSACKAQDIARREMQELLGSGSSRGSCARLR